MSYWWRAEKVSQDELIKGLRNEISKTIYLAHPHIEHISNEWNEEIRNDIENLVDPLWQEYSKRGEPFRLQLHDLTFNQWTLPSGTMHLNLFGIRNHNSEGESHWALVQNLSFLESILLKRGGISARDTADNGEQPRKRQRTRECLSRLRLKLRSRDVGTQRTALQLLPFLVEGFGIAGEDLTSILDDLVACVSNKDQITASWALVASAR
ncbi:Serine/threonine-protein kinase tel1 [Metarhizium acridum]|uniref:Serine/threonine-protein kinase tel1 n=1 Tax=Metarhizium acridum TaxID=92637 RepID=UPI001C6B2FC9|nr:Serine/threonine-protein kinase tel1 [Metarhizium acridum]